jgi:CBS domain-containing protein
MTCRDIMTPDPSCCLPSDSVAIAAQIMRRNDVGPVLVVSDHHENRLVGIVTDRDLALKVIADGRDPHTTRVDEVMSTNPVSCRPDDSTARALELMAENQVRRVPIVDENDRLVGIVAQADVARNEDEQEVGRMVEQISEPYGSSSWTETRPSQLAAWAPGSSMALGALCMGLGAGLMYVLDPTRGRTRRTRMAQKATGLYNSSADAVSRTGRHLMNQASGLAASASSTKSSWKQDDVPDDKIVARIKSKMGRYVSHPGAVNVTARNGHVTLSGPILADETRALIDCVNGVPGVRSVESRLDVHDFAGSHPSLQGGRNLSRYTCIGRHWRPAVWHAVGQRPAAVIRQ